MTATDRASMRADEALFGPVVFRYGARAAIRDGWLVDFRVVLPIVDVGAATSPQGSAPHVNGEAPGAVSSEGPAPPTPVLGGWGAEPGGVVGGGAPYEYAAAGLAAALRALPARRVIAYANRNADARRLAELLRGLLDGVAVFCVDGTMPAAARAAAVAAFLAAPRAVLCNVKVLAEGADLPAADAVAFCDAKDSVVDIVQCAGRALRPAPGKPAAWIIAPVVARPDAADPLLGEAARKVRRLLRVLAQMDEALAEDLRVGVRRPRRPPSTGVRGPRPLRPPGLRPRCADFHANTEDGVPGVEGGLAPLGGAPGVEAQPRGAGGEAPNASAGGRRGRSPLQEKRGSGSPRQPCCLLGAALDPTRAAALAAAVRLQVRAAAPPPPLDLDADKYALMVNINPDYHRWWQLFAADGARLTSKQTLKQYLGGRELPVVYKGNSPLGVLGFGRVVRASHVGGLRPPSNAPPSTGDTGVGERALRPPPALASGGHAPPR